MDFSLKHVAKGAVGVYAGNMFLAQAQNIVAPSGWSSQGMQDVFVSLYFAAFVIAGMKFIPG